MVVRVVWWLVILSGSMGLMVLMVRMGLIGLTGRMGLLVVWGCWVVLCRWCSRGGVRVRWWGRRGVCLSFCVLILGWMWRMLGFLCFLGLCLRIVLLLLVGVRSWWMGWVRGLRVALRGMLCVGVLVVVLGVLCLCFLGRVRSGLGWRGSCWIARRCLLSG